VRLLRLDQKLIDGIPMNPRRLANTLNTKPELLREFCGHLAKPGDETVVLLADGRAVEIRTYSMRRPDRGFIRTDLQG
jgi:hypothetical protein